MPEIPFYEASAEDVLEELFARQNVLTANITQEEKTTIAVTFTYMGSESSFAIIADNLMHAGYLALTFLDSM